MGTVIEGKPLNTGSSALAAEIEEVVKSESRTTTNAFLRNLLLIPVGVFTCECMRLLSQRAITFWGNLAGVPINVTMKDKEIKCSR